MCTLLVTSRAEAGLSMLPSSGSTLEE